MKRLLNHSDGLLRAGRSFWLRGALRALGILPPELHRGPSRAFFDPDVTMPAPWLGVTLHGKASLRLDQLSSALRGPSSFKYAAGFSKVLPQHVVVVEDASSLSSFRQVVLENTKQVAASVRNGRVVILVFDERKCATQDTHAALPPEAIGPAVEGFTRSLAKEVGSNGTVVNCLLVRGSRSSFDCVMGGPLQAQLVQPLSFLLSPDAAFISGQTVVLQLDKLLSTAGTSHHPTTASPADASADCSQEQQISTTAGVPVSAPAPQRYLSGRVAVVTGAARGIGAAIASRLASEGATVVGVDVPAAAETLTATMRRICEEQAEQAEKGGSTAGRASAPTAPSALALPLDITSSDAPHQLRGALEDLRQRRLAVDAMPLHAQPHPQPHPLPHPLPQPLLHIMVHNAGITRDRMLRAMDSARWSDVQAVNLEAIMRLNRELLGLGLGLGVGTGETGSSTHAAPALCPIHGRIISMSSINGIAGARGQTNYAWTKGALIGYTEALAEELQARYPLSAAHLASPSPAGGSGFGWRRPGATAMRVLDRPSAFAVAPGFIETAMVAKMPFTIRNLGRRSNALLQGGLPEDVAAAVAFLCLPGSAAATGSTLRVCGGNMVGK